MKLRCSRPANNLSLEHRKIEYSNYTDNISYEIGYALAIQIGAEMRNTIGRCGLPIGMRRFCSCMYRMRYNQSNWSVTGQYFQVIIDS